MSKTLIASALLAIGFIHPASAQTTVPVRPFAEYATEFAARYATIQMHLDINDWSSAAQDTHDLTLWLLEEQPEACYAYVWGMAVAISAASTPTLLTAAWSESNPGSIDMSTVTLALNQQQFIEKLTEVSSKLADMPPLSCE